MTSEQPINEEHLVSKEKSTNEEMPTNEELLAPFRESYDGIHAMYRDNVWPVYAGIIHQPGRTTEESVNEFKAIRDEHIDDLCLRVIKAVRELGYAHVDEMGVENVHQVLFHEYGHEEKNRLLEVEMLRDAEAYLEEQQQRQKADEAAKIPRRDVVERRQVDCTKAAKTCQKSRTSNTRASNAISAADDFRTETEDWKSLLSEAEVARMLHVRSLAREKVEELGLVTEEDDAHRALRHEWVRRAKEDRKNRDFETGDEEASAGE